MASSRTRHDSPRRESPLPRRHAPKSHSQQHLVAYTGRKHASRAPHIAGFGGRFLQRAVEAADTQYQREALRAVAPALDPLESESEEDSSSDGNQDESDVCVENNIYWRGRLGVGSWREMEHAVARGARVVCVAHDLLNVPGTRKRITDGIDVRIEDLHGVFAEVEALYLTESTKSLFLCCREGLNRSVAMFLRLCSLYTSSPAVDILEDMRTRYDPRVLNPRNYAVSLHFAPFAGLVTHSIPRRGEHLS